MDEQLLRDCLGPLAAAEESDGNPSLSEQTLVTLRAGGFRRALAPDSCPLRPGRGLRPSSGQDLAGFAVVVEEADGTGVLEIAVHPSYRNQGVADRLVAR